MVILGFQGAKTNSTSNPLPHHSTLTVNRNSGKPTFTGVEEQLLKDKYEAHHRRAERLLEAVEHLQKTNPKTGRTIQGMDVLLLVEESLRQGGYKPGNDEDTYGHALNAVERAKALEAQRASQGTLGSFLSRIKHWPGIPGNGADLSKLYPGSDMHYFDAVAEQLVDMELLRLQPVFFNLAEYLTLTDLGKTLLNKQREKRLKQADAPLIEL